MLTNVPRQTSEVQVDNSIQERINNESRKNLISMFSSLFNVLLRFSKGLLLSSSSSNCSKNNDPYFESVVDGNIWQVIKLAHITESSIVVIKPIVIVSSFFRSFIEYQIRILNDILILFKLDINRFEKQESLRILHNLSTSVAHKKATKEFYSSLYDRELLNKESFNSRHDSIKKQVLDQEMIGVPLSSRRNAPKSNQTNSKNRLIRIPRNPPQTLDINNVVYNFNDLKLNSANETNVQASLEAQLRPDSERKGPTIGRRSQTIDVVGLELARLVARNQRLMNNLDEIVAESEFDITRNSESNEALKYNQSKLCLDLNNTISSSNYPEVNQSARPRLNNMYPGHTTDQFSTDNDRKMLMTKNTNHIHDGSVLLARDYLNPRSKKPSIDASVHNRSDGELMGRRHEHNHNHNHPALSHSSRFSYFTSSTETPKAIYGSTSLSHRHVNRAQSSNYLMSTDVIKSDQVTVGGVKESKDNVKLGHTKSKRLPVNLSLAGAKRRLGFKKKGLTQISVHRSEEIMPFGSQLLSNINQSSDFEFSPLQKQTFSIIDGRYDSRGNSPNYMLPPTTETNFGESFVKGLGEGQVVSRQALVCPNLGSLQLSLSNERGMLEVEVIRARQLHKKPGPQNLPNPFVKIYLMKSKICIAKFKTEAIKETLDPLFQRRFVFRGEIDLRNCVLQAIVWGDYGRKDRKSLMGIAQIKLDEVNISEVLIDWYKLFNLPSLSGAMLSSRSLRNRLLNIDQADKSYNISNDSDY